MQVSTKRGAKWRVKKIKICFGKYAFIELHLQPRKGNVYDLYELNRDVAEWSNALVLKTSVPRGTGGSNPSPSAGISVSHVVQWKEESVSSSSAVGRKSVHFGAILL